MTDLSEHDLGCRSYSVDRDIDLVRYYWTYFFDGVPQWYRRGIFYELST